MSRRAVALALVLPLVALLLLVADASLPDRVGPGPDAPTAIVALGDSTMSGEGAGSYEPGTDGEDDNWCHRSTKASVHHTKAPVDKVFNLACSGANAEQVGLTDRVRNTEGSQARQLARIAREYRVTTVLVAVGANDDPRFSDVLGTCLQAWIQRRNDCSKALTDDWRGRVDRMSPKVERALRDIRQVLHDSGYTPRSYTLVLQSYAAPVSPDLPLDLQNLAGCPLRTADLRWVRDNAVDELSAGLRKAASAVGARFLDLSRAGDGHEACARGKDADDEWFTRLTVDFEGLRDEARARHALQESFHPNARGHEQFGRCMTAFLATPARSATCVADQAGNLTPIPERD
ncbi:GDSL-type esterase/lipase family protein [Saccharothrix australiensis]|uniref:GDSL-like lipase/acylhydrolase family protein n=1 Tax=Saccharothrix australiensis TaxID=2072 RepID=A0A495W3W2_9PSEU|nr:GDSL-type esterase/lipase family protein [Saccharothrix australiensis]RKT56189.1 GDSL-like lipase/acylhydrolase family protein [Saccharothrix australiensis]